MGKINSRELAVTAIKRDLEKELIEILNKEPELKDEYINKAHDHTPLGIGAYYGSRLSSKVLIDLGCNINKQDKVEGLTPLMIACRRNHLQLAEMYLDKGANAFIRSNRDLTALDYSILQGNYQISYLLITKGHVSLTKSLEEYIRINLEDNYPLFNLPLFYQSLVDKVEPEAVPSFLLLNQKKKSNMNNDYLLVIRSNLPELDESWTNFFMRQLDLELVPSKENEDIIPLDKRKLNNLPIRRHNESAKDFKCK